MSTVGGGGYAAYLYNDITSATDASATSTWTPNNQGRAGGSAAGRGRAGGTITQPRLRRAGGGSSRSGSGRCADRRRRQL